MNLKGVEPMGLFWSMQPAPNQRSGLRLSKKDSTTPYKVTLSVFSEHVETNTIDQNKDLSVLAQSEIYRSYMGKNVKRVTISTGTLRGALYIPEGEGPFPTTLDIYGTAGGLIENRAALLASRGFLALTLAYFRYEDLPTDMYNINLEYFEEGINFLVNHPLHNKQGIGIIGVSQGAEIMLSTATICDKVKACVAINGYHYRTVADHHYNGVRLSAVIPDAGEIEMMDAECLACRNCYEAYSAEHMIPVENATCNFLIINGEDDGMVAPVCGKGVAERLETHGKCNYEILLYPGAGHLLEPPHAPHCRASYHIMGNQFYWGGKPKSHSYAQEDAWRRMLHFLRSNLVFETFSNSVESKL